MNMMQSSIQLAGHACTYIKKLTNFQNKNCRNSQISLSQKKTKKKKKKKKKEEENQKQGNIITNNIIKNKPKNSIINNKAVSLAYKPYVLSSIRLA